MVSCLPGGAGLLPSTVGTILQATKPVQQTNKSTSTRHRPRCNDANEQNGTKQDGLARPLGSRPHFFLFIHGWSQLRGVLYFCAGYQKLPAMGSVFSHSHNKKNKFAIEKSCWQDHPFLGGEALSLRFFVLQKTCPNHDESIYFNPSQTCNSPIGIFRSKLSTKLETTSLSSF